MTGTPQRIASQPVVPVITQATEAFLIKEKLSSQGESSLTFGKDLISL